MNRFAIAVSLLCGACLPAIEGSGQPDDPGDQPQGEPTPPPVTTVEITVHGQAGPLVGVPVVFLKTDDSVVADVVTDSLGKATATMPDGGSVTVVRPGTPATGGGLPMDPNNGGATPAQVYTYVGVKPGDKLDLVTSDVSPGAPVTARVMVPATELGGPFAVITPCGSAQGAAPYIDVTLTGCGPQTDFYVVDLVEQLSFLKRSAIGATVDLSMETLQDSLSTTLSATNAPSGASVAIETRLETDLFRPVYSSGMVAQGAPDQAGADTSTTTVDLPKLASAEQHVSARIGTADGTQLVTMRAGYGQADLVIDVAPHLIKSPSAATLTTDTVTWTELGTGSPDLVFATLRDATRVRTIVAPYGGASLHVPHLPTAHDAFNAQATDTPSVSLARVASGYDGVRARVFAGPLAPLGGYATISSAVSAGVGTDNDPMKP
jgi:hypothetical protein